MKTATITIQATASDLHTRTTDEVQGLVFDSVPSLAVTPVQLWDWDVDTKERKLRDIGWNVTHVPSGRSFNSTDYTQEEAIALLQRLADTRIDWTRSYEDITADAAVCEIIRQTIVNFNVSIQTASEDGEYED